MAGSKKNTRLTSVDRSEREMPVLRASAQEIAESGDLAGHVVAIAVHITAETAVLANAISSAGAEHVVVCSSNPRTSSSTAIEALEDNGVEVCARPATTMDEHAQNFRSVLDREPTLAIDDGAELIALSHEESNRASPLLGALEETTSGVQRVRNILQRHSLRYPIVDVNGSQTKHLFDNRYGTGQSTADAIMRSTNRLLAGAVVTVLGYGFCGKGISSVLRGLGAQVRVVDPDPIAALDAHYGGFRVLRQREAVPESDIIVTATGASAVLGSSDWDLMPDHCLLVNSGHFRDEMDLDSLSEAAVHCSHDDPNISTYTLGDGRRIHVLADGNVANLAVANGNPASLMDLSFSTQINGLAWLARSHSRMDPGLHAIPREIEEIVAMRKLKSLGIGAGTHRKVGVL